MLTALHVLTALHMLTALHVLSVLHLIPVLSGRHPMNPFEYFNKIIYIRISAARGYHMDGECGRIRIGGQSPDSRGVKRLYTISTLVPALLFFCVALMLVFVYPLNKRKVEENSAVLQERRNA